MSYSTFSISELERKFNVQIDLTDSVFEEIAPVEISAWLSETLREHVPLALAIATEKARSEFIVAPMLSELRRRMNHQISLFSGVDFTIDPARGLNGVCDFLVSRSTQQLTVESPVIVLVEAKNDNIKGGIPQCIAEMIAAQIFNEREGTPIEPIYGVVTTGSIWNFLKLKGQKIAVDSREYSIESPGKILGILVFAVTDPTQIETN